MVVDSVDNRRLSGVSRWNGHTGGLLVQRGCDCRLDI